MARKGRRGRLFVPRMSESLACGALASNTVVSAAFGNTLDQECYAISTDCVVSGHGFTTGEGPILVGLAHGDYTAAEIEEWLEANASWASSDQIANERAKRKCRIIGYLEEMTGGDRLVNNGKKSRVKLGWKVQEGETFQLWAYNEGSAVLTTGGIVEIKGPVYFKPL